MIEYMQPSLFDEFIEDEDSANIVEEYREYTLVQDDDPENENNFIYKVFDDAGVMVSKFESAMNCLDMNYSKYKICPIATTFHSVVYRQRMAKYEKSRKSAVASTVNDTSKNYNSNWPKYNDSNWHYEPPKPKTGYLDKLNKSDTLVIHKTDPTTTMLAQIYEGKGWDVLNDTYISKNEMHELIKNHDKIYMLGHGSGYGLMGGNIGPEEAPLLADKKLFVIWCNADAYFNHYLPNKHGFFCTGNMPSDSGEARWVGFNVSREYMDENITYWCKLCGDVSEQAINGDPEGAVKYIREKYWEKYGQGYLPDVVSDIAKDNVENAIPDEVGITKYNYNRTKVQ